MIQFYWWIIGQWLLFYGKAKTLYSVQDPEVRDFAEKVIDDDRYYYAFPFVEGLRYKLSKNEKMLPIEDYGAGSKFGDDAQKSISRIAKESAISRREGEWLFKIVNWVQPLSMLELGTSLGISAVYQGAPVPRSRFVTLEGNKAVAETAQNVIASAGLGVEIEIGEFAKTLPTVLANMEELDYVYMDGDHRKTPTIEYFEMILPHLKEGSIVVIGDNHWSAEMLAAWNELKKHKAVKWSVDMFDFGVLCIGEGKGEVYNLIATKYKPWQRLGK